jgi:hypothetical protein
MLGPWGSGEGIDIRTQKVGRKAEKRKRESGE